MIVNNRLESSMLAPQISRSSYRKTMQNVVLAFLFNGIGIPAAATGLFFDAINSVGRGVLSAPPERD